MYLNYRELDADIIIIGSGLTGLSAAYYLLEKDPHIDFLILDVDSRKPDDESFSTAQSSVWSLKWTKSAGENQQQLARRNSRKMVTFEKSKTNFQYISSLQKKLIRLLRKFNISFGRREDHYSSSSGKIVVDYGSKYNCYNKEDIFCFFNDQDRKALRNFTKEIDDLSKNILFDKLNYEVNSAFDEITMEDFLQQKIQQKRVRDMIAQTFLINSGLKLSDVSLLFYLAYCNSIKSFRNQFYTSKDGLYEYCIQNGSEKLSSAFRSVIGSESILKVSSIDEISWDNTAVGIKTPQKYYFSRIIIFTLSEGAIDRIKFVPPLSRKNENNRKKRRLKKFEILYDQPFWTKTGMSGDIHVMNTENLNGPIQLCENFVSSDKFCLLTGLANIESNKDDILEQLAFYFGEEAISPIDYNEYYGSFLDAQYSIGFSNMKNYDEILKSFGRIIWSSPESCSRWYGTMAGSVDAGFHGALRTLQEIRPSLLNLEDLDLLSPREVSIPQRMIGIFGIKWHILVPIVLLGMFLIVRVRRHLQERKLPTDV